MKTSLSHSEIKNVELKMLFNKLNGNLQMNSNCLASLLEDKATVNGSDYNTINDKTRESIVNSLRKLVQTLNDIQSIVWSVDNKITGPEAIQYIKNQESQTAAFIEILKTLNK